jgi:hypothetical protein
MVSWLPNAAERQIPQIPQRQRQRRIRPRPHRAISEQGLDPAAGSWLLFCWLAGWLAGWLEPT